MTPEEIDALANEIGNRTTITYQVIGEKFQLTSRQLVKELLKKYPGSALQLFKRATSPEPSPNPPQP